MRNAAGLATNTVTGFEKIGSLDRVLHVAPLSFETTSAPSSS